VAIEFPAELRANAWDGARSPVLRDLVGVETWARKKIVRRFLAPQKLGDDRDWRNPEVGWGLVLPEDESISAADKAFGADAPEPIRRLIAHRPAAPVLRYRADLRAGLLRRYYENGGWNDLETSAPNYGTGRGRIPRYLLIYASPAQIPWSVQYALNLSTYAGRLDLRPEEGLGHYVDALIDDWGEAGGANPAQPLLWSTNLGVPDITWLMSRVVGAKLKELFDSDEELNGRRWLEAGKATCTALAEALATDQPGVICTTSHGMTGPLTDPVAMAANLGAPVGGESRPLVLDDLAGWSPAGAIWCALACCSAGSDAASRYADLISADKDLGAMVRGVSVACGARIAPLPRALLGMAKPLRAFVGHVEPTFNWTLQDPETKQVLSHTIVASLYNRLYQAEQRAPLGWALAPVFAESGAFFGSLTPGPVAPEDRGTLAIYRRLVAMDRQSLVILGDPTVSIRRKVS
jgi:hypothetical protein